MYRTRLPDDTSMYVIEKQHGYEIGIGETRIYLGQEYMRQEGEPIPLGAFISVMDNAKMPDDLARRIKECIMGR